MTFSLPQAKKKVPGTVKGRNGKTVKELNDNGNYGFNTVTGGLQADGNRDT